MKKLLLLLTTVLLFSDSYGQDYLGLSTGNYSGIQGVMLQPASVADNRYKFEFNFASTNIGFQNNYLGFSREFFINNRFSFNDYDTYADFQSNVLSEQTIRGNTARFNLTNRLNLPSVLFTTGKKSGIAIGIQSRTGIAIDNMNVNFARQLYNNFQDSAGYNRTDNLNGLSMNAMNWVEGNLTYGRVLLDNGKHFLKAGVTAKYLGGVSSWYLQANDLNVTVNNDSIMRASGSDVRYGHSESDFSGAQLKDFKPDANGIGFDAGLVYEFRGRINKFKILNLKGDSDDDFTTTRRDKNKYSFKVGVSLLDAGKLVFNSVDYARDFETNASAAINGINIKNTGIRNVQDLDTLINQNVNYTGALGQEFSVAMPTALSAQIDLHLFKGFYVNAMAYRPFTSLNKGTDSRVFTPDYYAVTPRWESRMAGLYVPIVLNNNYNDARELTAGATLRLGPVFVGTSNMITLFQKDEIQNANLHLGFKLPIAHGKPSKASRMFKQWTNTSKDETTIINNTDDGQPVERIIEEEKTIEKIIEKKVEEKERPAVQPIQIIINNYNSAGKGSDTRRVVDIDPQTGEQSERTVIVNDQNSNATNNKVSRQSEQNETEELRSMQEQIEYLKFKLKQKELLLDEIENDQELLRNGSSNEESKKKIDSLKNDFLYNNNFEYNGAAWDTGSSIFDARARMFELRKELMELDNKNVSLDRNIAKLEMTSEQERQGTTDARYAQNLEEIQTTLNELKAQDQKIIQPTRVYYHNSPEPNYEQRKDIDVVSPNFTKIAPVATNTLPESQVVKTDITNTKTTSIDPNTKEYEALRNEITTLRSELKNYKKDAKPRRRWTLFGNSRNTQQVVSQPAEVKIIRDTLIIEKPVERVVTKIIRDTITNTIEKNNFITKTETKIKNVEVEVDNTEKRLLDMPAYFVLFDVGSADVKQIYKSKLNYYATQIEKYENLKINLIGHADASGNAAANLALSKRRAQQVRNYLVLKGVAREKISIDFDGDKDPLADNTTKTGKSQNRRVDILFVN